MILKKKARTLNALDILNVCSAFFCFLRMQVENKGAGRRDGLDEKLDRKAGGFFLRIPEIPSSDDERLSVHVPSPATKLSRNSKDQDTHRCKSPRRDLASRRVGIGCSDDGTRRGLDISTERFDNEIMP